MIFNKTFKIEIFSQLAGAQWGSAWAVEDLSSSPGRISPQHHDRSGQISISDLTSSSSWLSIWTDFNFGFHIIIIWISFMRTLRFFCLIEFSCLGHFLQNDDDCISTCRVCREWIVWENGAFMPSFRKAMKTIFWWYPSCIHNRFKFGGMGYLACNDDKSHCRY